MPPRACTNRARPTLEGLEDRLLLSATAHAAASPGGQTAAISGVVFDDRDGDGLRGTGEPGTSGRTVFLDQDKNGKLGANEIRTTTRSDGSFSFTGLRPGSYLVCQDVPAGWSATRLVVSARPLEVSDADRLIRLDRFRSDPRFAGMDGEGFTVAVLDTGIDAGHPYFGPDNNRDGKADSLLHQYDFVNQDGVANDDGGHGTHVSSVIASRDPQNPGIAPGVNLIVLKVLDGTGSGNFTNIEKALQWVVANAARYRIASVNLSFGDGGAYARQTGLHGIADELAALASRNVAAVAAAGNGYHPGAVSGVMYPAADPNVISVGAVWDRNRGGPWVWDGDVRDDSSGPDRVVSFSQRAPGVVDLFAPGIFLNGAAPGGGTASLSGTSGATAVVSGVVALAQQVARDRLGRTLTLTELRTLLHRSGKVIRDGDDERDNVSNSNAYYRRVDALALGEAILALGSVSPAGKAGTLAVQVPAGKTVTGLLFGSRRGASNRPPVLTGPGVTQYLDENAANPAGATVAALLGNTWQDANPGAKRGIAVVNLHNAGQGRWQFSLDGGRSWRDFGPVSPTRACLLPDAARVRFVPARGFSGEASFEYRAWDQTSGNAGGSADLSRGGTAFGGQQMRVRFVVRPVNGAPALRGPGRLTAVPVNAAAPRGDAVTDLLAGKASDPDGTDQMGLAVLQVGGNGRWQFSRDNGRSWTDLADVNPGKVRLLAPADRLRFVPALNWKGTATVTYRAWDRSGGFPGGRADLRSGQAVGGTTPFSRETATASLAVGGVSASESPGPTLTKALAGTGVALQEGQGVGLVSLAGYGKWHYSLDGHTWKALPPVSRTAARLIPGRAWLRFVPAAGRPGLPRISFRRWDGKTGAAGGTANLTRANVPGFANDTVSINWPLT